VALALEPGGKLTGVGVDVRAPGSRYPMHRQAAGNLPTLDRALVAPKKRADLLPRVEPSIGFRRVVRRRHIPICPEMSRSAIAAPALPLIIPPQSGSGISRLPYHFICGLRGKTPR